METLPGKGLQTKCSDLQVLFQVNHPQDPSGMLVLGPGTPGMVPQTPLAGSRAGGGRYIIQRRLDRLPGLFAFSKHGQTAWNLVQEVVIGPLLPGFFWSAFKKTPSGPISLLLFRIDHLAGWPKTKLFRGVMSEGDISGTLFQGS